MKPWRTVIVGAGYLGKIHARLACSLAELQVVGVVDPLPGNRAAIQQELPIPVFADLAEIGEPFEAAIIATPTRTHDSITRELLSRGVHCLVEKPLTLSASDAAELVQLAHERACVLQVGHVERFNPAFIAARPFLRDVQFISAVRRAPYSFRSTDVSVVLDLMIHDLDLVLATIDAEPRSWEACGGKVFGPNDDWAEARVWFSNGAVAQFSASRVHPDVERSFLARSGAGSIHIDFQNKAVRQVSHQPGLAELGRQSTSMTPEQRTSLVSRLPTELMPTENLAIHNHNAILEEQRSFARAIADEENVVVSGVDGWRAVELAEAIMTEIAANSQHREQARKKFSHRDARPPQRRAA